jgi:hypothetical protein
MLVSTLRVTVRVSVVVCKRCVFDLFAVREKMRRESKCEREAFKFGVQQATRISIREHNINSRKSTEPQRRS